MNEMPEKCCHDHACGGDHGQGCAHPEPDHPRSDGLSRDAVPTGFSADEALVARNDPETYYAIELYYEHLPPWSIETVGSLLRSWDRTLRIDGRSTSTTFLFEFPGHRITSRAAEEQNGTASLCCLARSAAPPDPERLWEPLRQTWSWPGAGESLARCRGSILLTDLVPPNGTINPLERMKLLQRVLVSLLDASSVGMPAPLAIHWVPSGHFVSPEEFLTAYRTSNGFVGIPGPINVRVLPEEPSDTKDPEGSAPFAAAESQEPSRVRLDTLGLASLGFADFQIDATGRPISEVVRVLYNTALYVLERGAVIRDGHTIPGLTSEQKWPCRIDVSWMAPRRTVLTIEPTE